MKILSISMIIGLIITDILSPGKENTKIEDQPEVKKIPNIPSKPKEKKTVIIPPKSRLNHQEEKLVYQDQIIEEVYYVIVNHPEERYTFPGFHFCDMGIMIRFQNGKWLNYIWNEEGFGGRPEIKVSYSDQKHNLEDEFTQFFEVSDHPDWITIKGQELKNLNYQFQKASDDYEYISDIKLEFEYDSLSICATKEPDPEDLPKLSGLPFKQEWIVIVFEKNLLIEHKRVF